MLIKKIEKKRLNFKFFTKHPLLSFVGSVVVLAGAIVLSYFLRTNKTTLPEENLLPREVMVQNLGDQYLTVQGQVQKEGVVQIIAQTSGVVQKVNVSAGQVIKAKTSLLNLSTNYSGGNAAALQTRQAALAYQHNKDTIEAQKEVIALGRKQVDYAFDSAENQIKVSKESIDTLRSNLDTTRDQLNYINRDIEDLSKLNIDGAKEDELSPLRQQRMALLSGLSQVESSLKTVEYQTKDDTLATEMPEVQRDLANKQFELQEKALDLQLESSRLSLQLAGVQSSLMNPVSPLAGTVQKVNVKKGDLVSPGQVLAVINNESSAAYIEVSLTPEAALSLDAQAPAQIVVEGETLPLEITFVSQVPVNGNAYQMQLELPEELAAKLPHKTGVEVKLPIRVITPVASGNSASDSSRLVNIDAIYQTQQENYLYVVDQDETGQAVASIRTVTLGKVMGSQVEVMTGLATNDQVILNRQVKPGELVTVAK